MSEPTQPATNGMTRRNSHRLTILVKRFVDVLWYLGIGSLIIWPIAVLVIGLNIPSNIDERHTDINFPFSFKVYPQQLVEGSDQEGYPAELIQGQSEIKLNNTKSLRAWYLAGVISEVMGLIGLVALFYVRKIFANLTAKQAFNIENASFIEKVGYVFIVWNLLFSILTYLGGLAILSDVGEHSRSIHLAPAINIDLIGVFTGLAIIVLAGVIKEASILHEEQSLTI